MPTNDPFDMANSPGQRALRGLPPLTAPVDPNQPVWNGTGHPYDTQNWVVPSSSTPLEGSGQGTGGQTNLDSGGGAPIASSPTILPDQAGGGTSYPQQSKFTGVHSTGGTGYPQQTDAPLGTFGQPAKYGATSSTFGAYKAPQEQVTDALTQQKGPRFHSFNGLFGMGQR